MEPCWRQDALTVAHCVPLQGINGMQRNLLTLVELQDQETWRRQAVHAERPAPETQKTCSRLPAA